MSREQRASGAQLIKFGCGVVLVTLMVIAINAVMGGQTSVGRGATLSVIGIPFGVVMVVAGLIAQARERRRGDRQLRRRTSLGASRPPANRRGGSRLGSEIVVASADLRLREAVGRIGSTHVGDRSNSSCSRCRRSDRSPPGRGGDCENCPSSGMGQADVGTSREALARRKCSRAHHDLGLRRPLGCVELAHRSCSAARGASTDYGVQLSVPGDRDDA
jgi:hypothetical protein